MKLPLSIPPGARVLALLVAGTFSAGAALFTTDTQITFNDTNYDGQDIVVSNCVLTVDGPHAFAALHIQPGGLLTHSYAPYGFGRLQHATNDLQVLTGTDYVILSNANVVLDSVVVSAQGTVYTNNIDYIVANYTGYTLLQRTTNSAIADGATVSVDYDYNAITPTGITLSVAGDVSVDPGAAVRADGIGYGPHIGPGSGYSSFGLNATGSGGGHGGFGGITASNTAGGSTYGQVTQPNSVGSAGGDGATGPGGFGGGLISIVAGGSLQLHGTVSANGLNATNARAGGGAGGGIFFTARAISSSGSISANGGSGEPPLGGGGAGGRIALLCDTNLLAGSISASGGSGFQAGGAGTIFIQTATLTNGLVTIDNAGRPGAATPVSAPNNPDLLVTGAAILRPSSSFTVANLTIASNSWISPMPVMNPFTVTVLGDARLKDGGGVNLDGLGSPQNGGPGPGRVYSGPHPGGGGGGHAGYGGDGLPGYSPPGGPYVYAPGGNYYGFVWQPATLGSGGGGSSTYPGGSGGGAIHLVVNGALLLDGLVSANGSAPPLPGGGGGSGGSIWLTVGSLSGSGRVSASGGSAPPPTGGGGSGGRIALYSLTNDFAGSIVATGGSGFLPGAAGTLYIQTGSSIPHVIVDNAGHQTTNSFFNPTGPVDLSILGGARLTGSASIRNLYVGRGATFIPGTSASSINLNIAGNATIDSAGSLSMTGLGFPPNAGSGAGRYSSTGPSPCGSGAGAGGYGGISASAYPPGGMAYGYLYNPTLPGSGGGASSSTPFIGGSGGGALRLAVSGFLTVDGSISVDALPALSTGGGGGSGGSLLITTAGLAGSGLLSANGGNGDLPNGGGGAGGRIAIFYASNLFSGSISAKGGLGFAAGGAGTIFLRPNTQSYGQIIVDNGGVMGISSNTPLSGVYGEDLAVLGGAGATFGTSQANFGNIFVGSNSWLSTSSFQETWRFSTATIEAGGRIIANPRPSPGGQGSGRYGLNAGGGGAHAGFGGSGAPGFDYCAPGGAAFLEPQGMAASGGSGGIGAYSYNTGDGLGGGALTLSVRGLLTLNGRLSADGNDSNSSGSGGGAGGGLQLTLGGLAGSGTISARGGRGDLPNGGGGGGGYIAIGYASNSFSGTISAAGGQGFMPGGAGLIYLFNGPGNFNGRLIVDDEGLRGTNTLITYFNNADLLVRRGTVVTVGPQNFNNLVLETNSTLWVTNTLLTVRGSATIHTGAAILADGTGFGASLGPGPGITPPGGPGGGAAHAGLGGIKSAPAYGNFQSPNMPGSGGGTGSGSSGSPLGGRGGGVINLNIPSGTLLLDGLISANGLPGGLNSGGGSGGSLVLNVATLAGSGTVSASGGAGNGQAGGGGGGRIALFCKTNLFTGTVSAFGGPGGAPGGAGTISSGLSSSNGRLLIDNGGLSGTNTPLTATFPVDLTIASAAVVHPATPYLILSNLSVGTGSSFTIPPGASPTLDLAVLHNLSVATGGAISVDYKGYRMGGGPGAGLSSGTFGSGAGYGAAGGASATIVGGPAYGSALAPVDPGSGGGPGISGPLLGSEGGGVIRLTVGGSLALDGAITANGNLGILDSSGGGSGGSIWLTAGHLAGAGHVLASGADGEFFGGGGGAGGRILLQVRTNDFTGSVAAPGGFGFEDGLPGSVNVTTSLPDLQVVAHSPSGVVSNSVSQLTLTFNAAVDPSSFPEVQLIPPGLPLLPGMTSVAPLSTTIYTVSFPQQSTVGDYTLLVSPPGQALVGMPFSQVYTGSFSIMLPQVRGRITDTNGLPIPGILIQPSGPFSSATTDANGDYRLGAPPGVAFSLTPTSPGLFFVPSSRSYTNVTEDITGQDYTMLTSVMGQLTSSQQDTNLVLRCSTVPGVQYQLLWSTNLLDWTPGSDWLPGTYGLLELKLPIGTDPAIFFRIQAQY